VKLVVVCSSLDLRAPLSSTPSWWQLLKALAEQGTDLVVAPYQGPAIESPWWTAAANPCRVEGDAVGLLKRVGARRRAASARATRRSGESPAERLQRRLANAWTKPRWRAHLDRLLACHRDTDALLLLTVPPNHFGGIPRHLLRTYGLPTYFYDGDVPASLPRFAGFSTGFKIYQGADLTEYAGVFSNSLGGVDELRRLGARDVRVLYYAADPEVWARLPVPEEFDVFFYGHGAEYREEWLDAMIAKPSRALPEAHFVVRGHALGRLGNAVALPYLSFTKLKEYCSRSRINLNIARQAHASVYASSTARPFELAALGCAVVSNPYAGLSEWFEPGHEVLVVTSTSEAADVYRQLLRDASARRELGARARRRLLAEHTYAHRATTLLQALG
jgi:glycosyltransferase involved in cell wall biosynthesis